MTPKLLVNENFPAPSILRLRDAGYDVVAVSEVSPGCTDIAVLEHAVREGRWLVTFDRDYGELIFARRAAAPPALILLRVPTYRPEEPADWLISLCVDAEKLAGAFVVFDGSAIRTRPWLSGVARGSR